MSPKGHIHHHRSAKLVSLVPQVFQAQNYVCFIKVCAHHNKVCIWSITGYACHVCAVCIVISVASSFIYELLYLCLCIFRVICWHIVIKNLRRTIGPSKSRMASVYACVYNSYYHIPSSPSSIYRTRAHVVGGGREDTLRFRVPLLQIRLSMLPEQLPEKETETPPAKMDSLCPL